MPYSNNPDRVRQLLPFFKHLLEGQDCYWNLTDRKVTARTFGYRMREALYISKTAVDPATKQLLFPDLAAIADQVRIKEEGERVYGIFQDKLDGVELSQSLGELPPDEAPSVALRPTNYSIVVIEALWNKRQGASVYLPMYVPDNDALSRLYEWGQRQQPVVLIMPTDNATTLVEYDEDIVEAAWTPDDVIPSY